MANDYSTLTSRLKTRLESVLSGKYNGLVVSRRHYKPDALPAFDRYCIIISPSPQPVTERRIAVREKQYILRCDLFLLVKNYDADKALFGDEEWETGDDPVDLGLFQLVFDVKDALLTDNLSGLLDKTYDEAGGDTATKGGGPVDFQELAANGLDAGSHPMVNRAKVPFVGRTVPFCHGK